MRSEFIAAQCIILTERIKINLRTELAFELKLIIILFVYSKLI